MSETAAAPNRNETKATDDRGGRLITMDHLFDNFYKMMVDLRIMCEKCQHIIVCAACSAGEGASTMALNFASALAIDAGKKILLVDGNLRTPMLHRHFDQPPGPGLAELLQGKCAVTDVLNAMNKTRLQFMPAGKSVSNPIILFESKRCKEVFEQLNGMFDFVIVDAAPLVRYPDTTILAQHMGGVVMILEAESTRREVALIAKQTLERAGVRLFGAILNKKQYFIPQKIYRLL